MENSHNDQPTKLADAIKIDGMELQERSTGGLVLTDRLTDTQLAEARETASLPLPALPICDERHLGQCLRVMRATLPRQNADDVSGELFVAAYQRKLGHMPKDQINYLTDQALERCKWFPTISECLEIAAAWKRDDDAVFNREKARSLVLRETQARLEDAMSQLARHEMTQEQFDTLPERYQHLAGVRGLVRKDGGNYIVRGTHGQG